MDRRSLHKIVLSARNGWQRRGNFVFQVFGKLREPILLGGSCRIASLLLNAGNFLFDPLRREVPLALLISGREQNIVLISRREISLQTVIILL